jgi:hypothetical protein
LTGHGIDAADGRQDPQFVADPHPWIYAI